MGKNNREGAGMCKYCGQTMIIGGVPPLPEGETIDTVDDATLEDAYNIAATLNCNCSEGQGYRDRHKAQAASDDNLDSLTEADDYLKEILAAGRDQMLQHPEMKGVSITVLDPVSSEKRVYKLKIDKDGNIIATRTNSTAAAEIIN